MRWSNKEIKFLYQIANYSWLRWYDIAKLINSRFHYDYPERSPEACCKKFLNH